jgi:hypothetical protein
LLKRFIILSSFFPILTFFERRRLPSSKEVLYIIGVIVLEAICPAASTRSICIKKLFGFSSIGKVSFISLFVLFISS